MIETIMTKSRDFLQICLISLSNGQVNFNLFNFNLI